MNASNALNADLADLVNKEVHRLRLGDVLADIRRHKSVFEDAFEESDPSRDPVRVMMDRGYHVEVHTYDDLDCFTVVLVYHRPSDETAVRRFVFAHDYVEGPDRERYLVEGRIERDRSSFIRVERMYFEDRRTGESGHTGVVYNNMIPFQLTLEAMDRSAADIVIEIDDPDSSSSHAKWTSPKPLFEWFLLTYDEYYKGVSV
jgi:hypothetical protein